MKRRHSLIDVPESTNFITTTIVYFMPILGIKPLAQIVMDNLEIYSQKYDTKIHGYVIMPSHIHLLVSKTSGSPISRFIGPVKEFSAKQIIKWSVDNNAVEYLHLFSSAAAESKEGHQYQVWQKRFDCYVVTDPEIMLGKLEYIHSNPIREHWRLCKEPEDYPYSSAAYYYKDGHTAIPVSKIS
jgi:putative transposase